MAKRTVLWAPEAQVQLRAIDRETALRFLHAIDDYLAAGSGEVKRLRPPRQELRLRVGDCRVFFLSRGALTIEILGFKHRSEAYR